MTKFENLTNMIKSFNMIKAIDLTDLTIDEQCALYDIADKMYKEHYKDDLNLKQRAVLKWNRFVTKN